MSELKQALHIDKISNSQAAKLLDVKHPLGRGAAFAFALGVFWNGRCEGVLTFGNPISNNAVKRYGLRQCDVLELRKLWISDVPPKNSESRILGIVAKIIRKRYPQLKLLLTYCGAEEAGSAYKATGWIGQEAHQYLREVKIAGKWFSVRDAQRKRILKSATEKKTENRRKYVLPLAPEIAQLLAASNKPRSAAKGADSTSGTSTSNKPSAPLTTTGVIGNTADKIQAQSPGSAPQRAANSSSARNGRQATKSTKQSATPVGSEP